MLPKKTGQELIKGVTAQKWRNAKTYENFAPHEYFLKSQNKRLFNLLSEAIEKYGKDESFLLREKQYKYRYFYLDKCRYWRIGEVLNRTNVENVGYRGEVSFPVIKKGNKLRKVG